MGPQRECEGERAHASDPREPGSPLSLAVPARDPRTSRLTSLSPGCFVRRLSGGRKLTRVRCHMTLPLPPRCVKEGAGQPWPLCAPPVGLWPGAPAPGPPPNPPAAASGHRGLQDRLWPAWSGGSFRLTWASWGRSVLPITALLPASPVLLVGLELRRERGKCLYSADTRVALTCQASF